MKKDKAILRRNKMFWHFARDDSMFTTIRVISKHQDIQVWSALLLRNLTNQAMFDSEAYKTYHAYATGEKIPIPNDDDEDDNNEQIESDDDGDDFGHPKLSTHDEEKTKEDSFDPVVQTPSYVEYTDDEDYDEVTQGDVPITTNVEIPPSSFEDRVKALEDDFSEFKQTNRFAELDRLRDEAQAKNEEFINKLDEHIKKIIKEKIKVQVKEKVSKILPKIKKFVNDQFESKVLTRSSSESKNSHAVAASLSELELKKILIDKMESNKLIHRSDQQKTLYKELIEAYETDKVILDIYIETLSRSNAVKRMRMMTKNPLLD
uniref:Uncharacterized protein n=1 Tax=Tanacetum cinerariifolium TaxID=118510 RepID=A0A699KAX6_TANCI|nr:hypothetical protein [Tanacetum cinerariifolium]